METGGINFADVIEAVAHGVTEMPFASGSGPVTGGAKFFDESDLLGGQRPVQLFGVGLMWVSTGDDGCPAGAA